MRGALVVQECQRESYNNFRVCIPTTFAFFLRAANRHLYSQAKVAFTLVLRCFESSENTVAICSAKTTSGGPCQATPMENGRCRIHGGPSPGPKTDAGKARLAQCRSEIALRRHAASRASGQPARFGELTPKRLEAQREANRGKAKSAEHRAKIAFGVVKYHAARRYPRRRSLT
jgi:hypothetical protein